MTTVSTSADQRPAGQQIGRQTLGKQIRDRLREDILFARLRPHSSLTQSEVCERFGVSRPPVRDAFAALVAEGFLVGNDSGKVEVAVISAESLLDSYQVQGMLHGFATARLCTLIGDEELDQLSELHHAMASCEAEPSRYGELNQRFHSSINHMAKSRTLITALRVVATIPQTWALQFPDATRRATEEHSAILEAVAHRDADTAEAIQRDHIAQAGRDLVDYLRNIGVPLR